MKAFVIATALVSMASVCFAKESVEHAPAPHNIPVEPSDVRTEGANADRDTSNSSRTMSKKDRLGRNVRGRDHKVPTESAKQSGEKNRAAEGTTN